MYCAQVPASRDKLEDISLIGVPAPMTTDALGEPPRLPPGELLEGLAGSGVPFFSQAYEGSVPPCHCYLFIAIWQLLLSNRPNVTWVAALAIE